MATVVAAVGPDRTEGPTGYGMSRSFVPGTPATRKSGVGMSDRNRHTRRVALGLILVGGLLMVTASGGLISQTADRGFALNTTSDDSAYLGIVYPEANESRVVELETSDGTFVCDVDIDPFGCIYGHYEYDGLALLGLIDQTPSDQLAVDSIDDNVSGDDIATDINYGTGPGYIESASGSFECTTGIQFIGQPSQQQANATVTFSIDASSPPDSLSISLEREIEVLCVPE